MEIKRSLTLALVLMMALALAVPAFAGAESAAPADTVEFSVASLMVTAGANFEDALYQKLNEKFNFKMDVVPLTWDDYQQKPRIWMASGDAPDTFTWDFNATDLNNYIAQELIEPLPDDWQTKYPNLAYALSKTSITQFLMDKYNGKLYCVPHTAYMDPPTTPVLQHYVMYYRKDWAKQVGVELGDVVTLDEMFNLARKFIAEDPGKNGAGNTIGVTSRSLFINEMIVSPFNKQYINFYNDGSEYRWGPADPATLDGLKYLKGVFDEGLIDRDYYTISGKDFYDKFYSGRAGIMLGEGHGNEQNVIRNDFASFNPTLADKDALGICVLVGNDGKWRGNEQPNFWTASLFKKGIAPEKMNRILSIMDYLSTDEGYRFIRLGVEGKDYTANADGTVTITRENDPATGAPIDIMNVYPSQRVWVFMSVLDDQWGIINPTIPQVTRDKVVELFKLKQERGDIRMIDWNINLFTAPTFDKFKPKMEDEIPRLITQSGDIETNWKNWISENKPLVDRVLEELTTGIK